MKPGKNRNLEIVATVSAQRVTPQWTRDFQAAGATYFRINGAFETLANIRTMIESLQKVAGRRAPIWLDIPRNKIRINPDWTRLPFVSGQAIKLVEKDVNFPEFFQPLKRGDIIYAKDSTYRFKVETRGSTWAVLRAEQDGVIRPGMGLHRLGGWDGLPLFSPWDLELIALAREYDVPYLGISYLRHAHEIRDIRRAIGDRAKPIFKIETWHAYEELPQILDQLDMISVDRGDLSSEIGIENIHTALRRIIRAALRRKIKVFLATQFLQNMILNPLPSISEVTSLHEAFEDRIHGIQLSEETAAGRFPLEALGWLTRLFGAWNAAGRR
jgi:pyruvate kinase